MKLAAILFVAAFLGVTQAASYASIQAAVAGIPELSLLEDNIAVSSGLTLTDTLKDPSFVGTLFAPTNAVLQPLKAAVGSDLSTMLGDPAQVNDVLSMSVVPGKAYTLADLIALDGKTLATLNGNTVNVTVKQGTAGKIVYINEAPITGANIKAGNSMIFEMGGIVVASDYQDLLNSLSPPLAAPASTVDMSQTSSDTATPIPTTDGTPQTPADGTTTTDTPEAGTTTTTTDQKKNSASSSIVGAALLAVPALLAVLL